MKFIYVLLSIVFLITISSCSKDNSQTTATTCDPNISYASQISGILAASCNASGCHAAGSSHGDFTTYAKVYASRSAISSAVTRGSMPTGGYSITSTQKTQLLCWLNNGAQNN